MCSMFRFLTIAAFVFCSSFHALAYAQDESPDLFEAKYSILMKGAKVAKMSRKFTRLEDGIYQYHSETRTTGFISLFRKDHIVETSRWRFDEKKLSPIDYLYKHSGGKKNRNVQIVFDWQNNKITNSIDGSSWKMPTSPNVMDKLLYQLAIMYDLEAGKEELLYTVADGGKTKVYNFEILGEETIKTPLGEFQTVKLERHKPNSRRKSTLWCAKNLAYLPIKVENIEKDGKVTTALINSLQGLGY